MPCPIANCSRKQQNFCHSFIHSIVDTWTFNSNNTYSHCLICPFCINCYFVWIAVHVNKRVLLQSRQEEIHSGDHIMKRCISLDMCHAYTKLSGVPLLHDTVHFTTYRSRKTREWGVLRERKSDRSYIIVIVVLYAHLIIYNRDMSRVYSITWYSLQHQNQ